MRRICAKSRAIKRHSFWRPACLRITHFPYRGIEVKNVLIVDSDIGFIFWLAKLLVEENYQPWPACSVLDATSLMNRRRLVPLDLLVVNPSVQGAAHLIESIRKKQPDLKVLAVDPITTGRFAASTRGALGRTPQITLPSRSGCAKSIACCAATIAPPRLVPRPQDQLPWYLSVPQPRPCYCRY